MNLLRSLLRPFNRRVATEGVRIERRGTLAARMNAASDRVDSAIDDLCKTVSMSRTDFNAMIERERSQDMLEFESFADKCTYRYVNGDGVTQLCRNAEHEHICTGKELCAKLACPRLREPRE